MIGTRCWSFNVGPISSYHKLTKKKKKKKASLFTKEKYEDSFGTRFLALS